tara:strand:+ start:1498 stop:2133 length:636 start_codon:yes stop_codon:yes gene_type:complete
MSVGDIWFNRVNCSTNNRNWSFGIHTEVSTESSDPEDGGVWSRAILAAVNTPLTAMLSGTSRLESVQSWRRFATDARAGMAISTGGVGDRPGDDLSNDNAVFFNLRQTAGDAKFNGGIYVAGQTQDDQELGSWGSTYVSGPLQTFADVFEDHIDAVSPDSGQCRPVVLSKKFTPVATPIGTALDIVTATPTTRVMSQRRRQQKVQGWYVAP